MPARAYSAPPGTGSTSVKKKAAASGTPPAPAPAASSACLSPAVNPLSPRCGDGLGGGRGVVPVGEGFGPILFFLTAEAGRCHVVAQLVDQDVAQDVETQRIAIRPDEMPHALPLL